MDKMANSDVCQSGMRGTEGKQPEKMEFLSLQLCNNVMAIFCDADKLKKNHK